MYFHNSSHIQYIAWKHAYLSLRITVIILVIFVIVISCLYGSVGCVKDLITQFILHSCLNPIFTFSHPQENVLSNNLRAILLHLLQSCPSTGRVRSKYLQAFFIVVTFSPCGESWSFSAACQQSKVVHCEGCSCNKCARACARFDLTNKQMRRR